MKQGDEVAMNHIMVERFSITSQKPFADVIRAIDSRVGHPNITYFYSSVQTAKDDEELQRLGTERLAQKAGCELTFVMKKIPGLLKPEIPSLLAMVRS